MKYLIKIIILSFLVAITTRFGISGESTGDKEGKNRNVTITGRIDDCFAGKVFHPKGVDVYAFDLWSSPKIIDLLKKMDALKNSTDNTRIQQFFNTYNEFSRVVRSQRNLGHAKSSSTGTFKLPQIVPGKRLVLVAIAEREDEATYYTYTETPHLKPGLNIFNIDMNADQRCTTQHFGSAPENQ